MSLITILYHKEYAPDGREFDLEKVPESHLVDQGWVDTPAKFGHSIWGGGEAHENAIRQMGQEFEAMPEAERKAAAIGATITPPGSQEEAERAVAERDAALASLKAKEDEAERLKRELAQAKQKLADHQSDAETQRAKGAGEAAAQASQRHNARANRDNATDDEVREALDRLDITDTANLTAAGIPTVEAIENLLGKNIHARQRDAAWAAYQAAKKTPPATGGGGDGGGGAEGGTGGTGTGADPTTL